MVKVVEFAGDRGLEYCSGKAVRMAVGRLADMMSSEADMLGQTRV